MSVLSKSRKKHRTISQLLINKEKETVLKSKNMNYKICLSVKDLSELSLIFQIDKKTLLFDLKQLFSDYNIHCYVNYLLNKLGSNGFPKEKKFKVHQLGAKIYKFIEFHQIPKSLVTWKSDFSFALNFVNTNQMNMLAYMLVLSPAEVMILQLEFYFTTIPEINFMSKNEQYAFFKKCLDIFMSFKHEPSFYLEKVFLNRLDKIIVKIFECYELSIYSYIKFFETKNAKVNLKFESTINLYKKFVVHLQKVDYKLDDNRINFIENFCEQNFKIFIKNSMKKYFNNPNILISNIFLIFQNYLEILQSLKTCCLFNIFKSLLYNDISKSLKQIIDIYIERLCQNKVYILDIGDFIPFKTLVYRFVSLKLVNNKFLKNFEKNFFPVYCIYITQMSDNFKSALHDTLKNSLTENNKLSDNVNYSIDLIDALKVGISFIKKIYDIVFPNYECIITSEIILNINKDKNLAGMYQTLLFIYTRNITHHLILFIKDSSNILLKQLMKNNTTQHNSLENNFLILNNIALCLKITNEFSNPKLPKMDLSTPVIPNDKTKKIYYNITAFLSVNSSNNVYYVVLNESILYKGSNHLTIQTSILNDNLQLKFLNSRDEELSKCILHPVQENDRIKIILKNKNLFVNLQICQIWKEESTLTFNSKMYKNICSTLLNTAIIQFIKKFYSNISWKIMLNKTKECYLGELMCDLLKNYYFNNLWNHICLKLCQDIQFLLNGLDDLDQIKDSKKIYLIDEKVKLNKMELQNLFFEFQLFISADQLKKEYLYYMALNFNNETFSQTNKALTKKEDANLKSSNVHYILYQEKQDVFIKKITQKSAFEAITNLNLAFLNACHNSGNALEASENMQEDKKTSIDGKFDMFKENFLENHFDYDLNEF
ncbi:hypothetical protein QEN19_000489 [Hanseniaspora menglaensis]